MKSIESLKLEVTGNKAESAVVSEDLDLNETGILVGHYHVSRVIEVGAKTEDFTLPHRFHVESMWSPGQSPESMWTLDIFFLVVAQPIFCPESMWTPCGVWLDSSCSIWTTWTPPWNTGNMNSPSKTSYGVHIDSLHLLVLCYLLYK